MTARTSFPRLALAAVFAMACAEAGSADPNPGATDAAIIPLADGGGPGRPADAGSPGAPVDAAPDARVSAPADAAPGRADARPTPPDAGPTADAAPRPDAARPRADAAPLCPRSPCDLVEQCGCSGAEVCDLDVADLPNTRCRNVNGAGGNETSTCAALEDCTGGYVCIQAGDEAACKEYCGTDADCPGPRGKCVITLSDGGTPIDGATVCSSNCDPTNAAAGGCPPSWGCYPGLLEGDEVIVDCAPAGSGRQGSSCSTSSDCAANYACINRTFGAQCLRLCDTGAPSCSAAPGTSCQRTTPPLTIGGRTYGICL
jgi:hypothetical protein